MCAAQTLIVNFAKQLTYSNSSLKQSPAVFQTHKRSEHAPFVHNGLSESK